MRVREIIPDKDCRYNHFVIHQSDYDNIRLYEGLITSVPRMYIQARIKKAFPHVTFYDRYDGYGITVEFKSKDFSKTIHQHFLRFLQVVGWYCSLTFINMEKVSSIDDNRLDRRDKVQFNIEPKYDIPFTHRLPSFVYHVTTEAFMRRIQQQGLSPRTTNKRSNHPDRVYVAVTFEAAKSIATDLVQYARNKPTEQHDIPVLLKIDTSLLLTGTRFFIDPNFSVGSDVSGVYTYSNIPPNALTRVDL